MDIEKIRTYCLKKKRVTESFPFNETTLVFKVMNKIFCLLSLTPPHTVNLKCEPEYAIELREKYDEVTPGYHMNKKYWNTIDIAGRVPDKEIHSWIDHSYELVVSGLPRKDKAILDA